MRTTLLEDAMTITAMRSMTANVLTEDTTTIANQLPQTGGLEGLEATSWLLLVLVCVV